MSEQGPKRPPKRFHFIDNTDVTASKTLSTQVRRHVMQEYMREKRWEARSKADEGIETAPSNQRRSVKSRRDPRVSKARSRDLNIAGLESPGSESGNSFPGTSYEAEEGQLSDVEEVVRQQPERLPGPRKLMSSFRLGSASFARIADMNPRAPYSPPATIASSDSAASSTKGTLQSYEATAMHSPEPQSILSAARTDPFDSLPMRLSVQDQELFDFYANVMPACSYGFERRSPRAHNWYLSVFIPEAMKGAVCFQNTILVHAANTQAWVKGLTETRLAILHRAKASQLLLHHYQQYPHDTSDATISATLSAAALEDFDPRIERRKYAWMHWQAAVQKIRDRGGPAALIQHNRLQMLINWSDYIFSGYNGHGATFYFDHQLSPGHSTDTEAQAIARAEIAWQCDEFITFLKCAEHLALVQAGMVDNPISRQQQPMRYTAFLPDQPLYNLLASPNGPRYTETGQFKQIISRLAALMTINTAVWEYRHSLELSESFLVELLENILHNDLDVHISVEALIQILLSGSRDPLLLHTERPWFVGRMAKVAKRLTRPTFEKLNDLLLRFLTLGPDLEPFVASWESELRTEILQAPLVSYQARFMLGSA